MRRGLGAIVGAAASLACAPEPPAICAAASPWVQVGERVEGVLHPYTDGDPIEVDARTTPARLQLDYDLGGLDLSEQVSVVVRVGRAGEGTEDYLGAAILGCDGEAPATHTALLDWPSAWPAPSELDGSSIDVDTVFVDHTGEVAEVEVSLVVDAAR